ncbi:MAG TPA: PQQ-binding-like beta-propeller repeat protein [Candidatus Dormibacteraeota bacterium]|nr:PQQ-binding-like beta-propeller repeat protein [Candidatus Dormibacteraeota bacterium]
MNAIRLASAIAVALLWAGALAVQAAPLPTRSVPRAVTPVTPNGTWTTYHHDNAHTGFDSSRPTAATATAGWVSGTFDETVYGEPLVNQGIVYVATLNNSVYALNQSDGSLIWTNHLETPATGPWTCGNFSTQGIVGTPVIDATGGRIYVATLASDHIYRLEGLNLVTGVRELNTVITTPAGSAFHWQIQQQRGALGLANGNVYVPFGGRAGDCGAYHGWIFAVPTSGAAVTNDYVTPGQGAGFWTAGGVVIDDSTGKVFNTSGNGTGSGCAANGDGTPQFENDAIVRLSSIMAHEDSFIPQDWQANWCANDQDLGSASMVLINPTLAFQAGKWGNGFLVNPATLGGMDGQLYPTPKPAAYSSVDVCLGSHRDANFGSYAYAAPYVYLSCDHNSVDSIAGALVGLKVDTAAKTFTNCDATCAAPSWHTADITFGPPIVAGGAVWVVDIGGGGLYGFNATTGAEIYHSASFGVTHFSTPSEAGGQIFVSSGNVVREFNMVAGCTGVALGAAPASPGATGGTVLLTASGVTACTNPVYRFWAQPPGGPWSIIRDYTSSATFSWPSPGTAGIYHIEVDVKDAASSASYDSTANIPYTLAGCTGANISAAPPSPRAPGPTVVVTGSATCLGTPVYRFWVRAPGGPWTIQQDYSTAATYNWPTASLALGNYGLEVDVKNQGGTDSYETANNFVYSLSVGTCFTPTLSALPTSPGATGAPVTFSSTTSGCPNPLFRFWIKGPNGPWTVMQDYGTATSFAWTGTGFAGSYNIEVDVRDAAEGNSVSYDTVRNITYVLNGCSGVMLGTNPNSPQYPSGSVVLTGLGTCPGTPTYRFWVQAPGGPWTINRDYSATNTYSWPIAGLALGIYHLEVDVRDQGARDTYEKVNNLTYTLSAAPCATPTLGANPPTPGPTGATVTFTAATSGCTTPRYRFWVRAPSGPWVIMQDYSPTNTFAWSGTGLAGSYGIEVDVRDALSSVDHDAAGNLTYVVNGCSAVSITASPPTSTAHGSTVTFTATATCPGTPSYKFWIRPPGGAWTVVQVYGPSNTFSWTGSSSPINTQTVGAYTIEIDVKDLGGTDTYEKVNSIGYSLT